MSIKTCLHFLKTQDESVIIEVLKELYTHLPNSLSLKNRTGWQIDTYDEEGEYCLELWFDSSAGGDYNITYLISIGFDEENTTIQQEGFYDGYYIMADTYDYENPYYIDSKFHSVLDTIIRRYKINEL